MDFLLAKRLKDARYPQSLNKDAEYYVAPNVILRRKDIFTNTSHDNPKEVSTTNEFVYRPRLEELIEACGDEFHGIDRHQKLLAEPTIDKYDTQEPLFNGGVCWCATAVSIGKGTWGKTPEETIANLWIKLHE